MPNLLCPFRVWAKLKSLRSSIEPKLDAGFHGRVGAKPLRVPTEKRSSQAFLKTFGRDDYRVTVLAHDAGVYERGPPPFNLSYQRFDIHCWICEPFNLRRDPPAYHHLGEADVLRNRGQAAKPARSDHTASAAR